ncbi:ATP-binding cassette domain-containing protein [Oribacterium sinus]|uniref:ATP-binding cassette domain-containing protein n=1 Tax=Oribacterium sinus TaxID=237576 RepID=UPI0028D8633D|nr:ATP-binding cassette domain-containing protein [Oribacterium sinus]
MIEVQEIQKEFNGIKVLEGISFRVDDNNGLFIIGSSGCGKSTLLRIIAGFDYEYSGEISINGKKIDKKLSPNQRDIGIVFQDPTLWNHMTVKQNVSYGMMEKREERILEVVNGLQIEHLLHKYPEEISGGQAMRVSLARALLSDKGNLLLDEPLSNVDVQTKQIIMDYLRKNYCNCKCIIYVTHDRGEVKELPFKLLDIGK